MRLRIVRLLLPCVQGPLVREAEGVDFVTVLACVGFEPNESRNLPGELVQAPGCVPVRFGVRSGPQMGLEDDDDFGGILHAAIRHVSLLPAHSGPLLGARRDGMSFVADLTGGPSCGTRVSVRTTFHPQRRPSRRRGPWP